MFDMDGVLFDSMPYHAIAWHRTFLEYGFDIPPSALYLHEGRTGKSTVQILLGEKEASRWQEYYSRKVRHFQSFPPPSAMTGALASVRAVRTCGCSAIVVTGSSQKGLLERLERDFSGLFSAVVSSSDVVYGKPSPEPYLLGLSRMGVQPCDAMVVENAPLGVESGHAAGCFVAAVNTGPLPDRSLLDAGADVLFHSMEELSQAIPDLLSR